MALQEDPEGRPKVLVVDDDRRVCELLQALFESEGYLVRVAVDGQEGLQRFFDWRPSTIVMDVKMPKLDGWQLLDRIRQVSDVPIIMLTALGEEYDTVRGLQLGADDYVAKPIRRAELAARVRTMLRRAKPVQETAERFNDGTLWIDFSRHQVYVRGTPVELSPLEFRILAVLVRRQGIVLSAEQLLDLCWGERMGGAESVRIYIGYLRKKLGDDAKRPRLIETVREFGYRYRPQAGNPELGAAGDAVRG